jgi:GTP diphosphokinase / guanosine-3',5'-bis(diphosphate) 3'-diphosphatase
MQQTSLSSSASVSVGNQPSGPRADETAERLLALRAERMPSSDITLLRKTWQEAQRMYGEQMHWTGESLTDHMLGVLAHYLPFDPDDTGVIACLLHHALDTKLWTLDDLDREYGADVRSIIGAVHLLSRVSLHERTIAVEELRMMFLNVSHDMRTVLLVLCDYLRKLDCMIDLAPDMRRRLCRDVLQLFAPVAARLGVYSLKQRLESRAFPMLYPTDAARIAEQLEDLEKQFGNFLPGAAKKLEKRLAEHGIRAHVEGRQKQPYSIFQKMHGKSVSHIQSLFDLYALRVIVPDEASCYQTLGAIHHVAHPVTNRFKDYIGFPKPNGYRSLHTTVARLPGVPESIVVEVQIRTEAMQREAELGVAAHWSYKEGRDAFDAARRAELQNSVKNGGLSDHIFVLTPQGDIVELPEGATPLDFAFGVHTTLGLCFKAARVNGVIVPIAHPLENGDLVEIIRRTEPKPSYNWLGVLKTASARSRLKRHLALADREGTIQTGRDAVNAELQRRNFPVLDPDLTLLRSVDGVNLSLSERQELLLNIGRKAQTVTSLLRHVDALKGLLDDPKTHTQTLKAAAELRVAFDGGVDMPHKFVRCCKADEGPAMPIVGVAGRDGIVRIHRRSCAMLRNANPGRRVAVRWEEKTISRAKVKN